MKTSPFQERLAQAKEEQKQIDSLKAVERLEVEILLRYPRAFDDALCYLICDEIVHRVDPDIATVSSRRHQMGHVEVVKSIIEEAALNEIKKVLWHAKQDHPELRILLVTRPVAMTTIE